MKKSSLLWLSVWLVIFLSFPLSAQERTYFSNDLIEQVGHFQKESSFIETLGPERYGRDGNMDNKSAKNYPEGEYGPGGYGTENEGH